MRNIAIVNQKGGCGKTTTAINLSSTLALQNRKVLLIDMDPQSHSSIGLNVNVEDLEHSIYDIFSATAPKNLDDVILNVDKNFDLAPSQIILSAVEQELSGKMDRDTKLLESIRKMRKNYDYLLIDCPPSLGLLTFNALRACGEALIPIDMSVFSLQGVARLLKVINILKEEKSHDIRSKALATICNPRTHFAREVLRDIKQNFGKNMYKTVIHRTVKLKEAAGFGKPVTKYCKTCRGTEDYMALAGEVIAEEKEFTREESDLILGPRQNKGQIIFKYFDPGAKDVKIAGDFSNWQPIGNIMQTRGKNRLWTGKLRLPSGKYQYKFIVDGKWKLDPYNPNIIDGDIGIKNSLLEVL